MSMRSYKLVVSVAAGLMLVTTTSWARSKQIKGTVACSYSPSNVDFNGDGITGSLNNCVGKFNGGNFTSQSQIELLAPLASPATCPADTVEYPYAEITTVSTISSTDQTFAGEEGSGSLCLNPLTGAFTFDLTEFYFGGTGKFNKATGSVHQTGTGQNFVCDANGRCFGNSVGTFTGTLTLP